MIEIDLLLVVVFLTVLHFFYISGGCGDPCTKSVHLLVLILVAAVFGFIALYSLTREAAEAFLKKVKDSPTHCIQGPRDLLFKEVLKARDDGAKGGNIAGALSRNFKNWDIPIKVGSSYKGNTFRFYLKE